MTSDEIRQALTDCGLTYNYVIEEPHSRDVQVAMNQNSDFSYDVLSKLAAKLGTTDMRIYYEGEHHYSEVTFEGSSVTLWIRLPVELHALEAT